MLNVLSISGVALHSSFKALKKSWFFFKIIFVNLLVSCLGLIIIQIFKRRERQRQTETETETERDRVSRKRETETDRDRDRELPRQAQRFITNFLIIIIIIVFYDRKGRWTMQFSNKQIRH